MAVGKIDDQYRSQQAKAREAQKDAQRQIEDSQKQVKEARKEADTELETLKDQFSQQYTSLADRQAHQLAQQRLKAYEELLRNKRQHEAEIHRMQRRAEKEVGDIQTSADSEIMAAQTQAEKELSTLTRTVNQQKEFQSKAALGDLELEKQAHAARMGQIQSDHDSAQETLSEQRNQKYESTRQNHEKAVGELAGKYEKNYSDTVNQQSQALDKINADAARRLNALRQDHSMRLDAYQSRASDPFYQMVEAKTRLAEKDTHYLLIAQIPPHERDHVNVTVRGNQIILTGSRRNAESVTLAPGQTRSTQAFQSFSESFPIDWPVDARGMTQYYEGDTLVVSIPKKAVPGYEMHKAKPATPDRIVQAKPDFPANLPVTADQLRKPKGEQNA